MEVILAKTAGFCFGVKRAVSQVYDKVKEGAKIYTYGPIIHNDEVVKDLANQGVEIINDADDLTKVKDGTVVIRSHGVAKEIYDLMDECGIDYIDMTCPFVKRIHDIVYRESEQRKIVIIGSKIHPEVIGIMGWSRGRAVAVENEADVAAFEANESEKICIVSQTTFNLAKFQELVEMFTKKGYDINTVNTICDATRKRQTEAFEIASKVDAMIVIGDKKSSNSKKLYDICSAQCTNTYFIQTLDELDFVSDGVTSVGITAGASTPNYIIEEVQNYVRINF